MTSTNLICTSCVCLQQGTPVIGLVWRTRICYYCCAAAEENHTYLFNWFLHDLYNSRKVILSSFPDSSSQNTSKTLIFQNIWKRILEYFFTSNFISEYHLGRIINKLWLMIKSISESIFIFVNYGWLTWELVICWKIGLLKSLLNEFDVPINPSGGLCF